MLATAGVLTQLQNLSSGPIVESWAVSASNTNDLTCTLPSGVAAGNLLIVLGLNDYTSFNASSINTPAGYTQLFDYGNVNTDCWVQAWWKIASGSEVAPHITTSPSGYKVGWCLRITGHDASTPIDGYVNQQHTAIQALHTVSGITTLTANCLCLSVFAFDGIFSQSLSFTGGNDWAFIDYHDWPTLSATTGAQGIICQKAMGAAGATGSYQITAGRTDTAASGCIAIKAA